MNTIFISYSFSDANSAALCRIVREVATKLRRVTIVDGKTLDLRSDFSGTISAFIREFADCVVAIFTTDEKAKPNVLYEVGIGVGAGKDVILISESPDSIPSMLRGYDVIILNRNELDWQYGFRVRFEQKLRRIFQAPENHLVEDKIARRYQPEEIRHFGDLARIQAAIKIIQAGDLLKANAILNTLLHIDAANVDALFLSAECSYLKACSLHNPADREHLFLDQYNISLRALEINPNHILSLHSKGQAEFRLGRFTEAKSTFMQVLKIDPDFSLARYNLACVLALEDDKTAALQFLSSAIAQNPIWRDFAKGDPDFATLWQDQDWIELVYS
jgi:tetratricopeptide (TPR) repeat protein